LSAQVIFHVLSLLSVRNKTVYSAVLLGQIRFVPFENDLVDGITGRGIWENTGQSSRKRNFPALRDTIT
jgi:hypothetical protein